MSIELKKMIVLIEELKDRLHSVSLGKIPEQVLHDNIQFIRQQEALKKIELRCNNLPGHRVYLDDNLKHNPFRL